MSDLRDLYQEVILDHYRKPRNFRRLTDADRQAEGFNPLCGDRLTLYVKLKDEVIADASFEGSGCAISTASASLMTESIKGLTLADADALAERLLRMITAPPTAQIEDLGALTALAGVRWFPIRVKCAQLPWQAMRAAATAREDAVSTE